MRGTPEPGCSVTTEQPDQTDMKQRLRQLWEAYQAAEHTRADASTAVTEGLVAARAAGVSMYRMAAWLGVSNRAIQARFERHDQTNPKD